MLSYFLNSIWNLDSGKSELVKLISTKLLSQPLLDIMSGMLCLLVSKMPLVNYKTLWMISSTPLVISPLFTLMMFLSTPNPLMSIGSINIRSLIPSNAMVLLSLLRKSSYFKQRFVSLAMTFLKDKFVPLTKPFNLLTNSLLSLLIKHSYKDSLGLWTTLLSFIRIWGNNVNHSLIGYRIILLLGLIFILLLLKKSSLMLKLFLVLVFLLLMPLKLLKLMPLTLVMKEFWNNLFPQTHLNK